MELLISELRITWREHGSVKSSRPLPGGGGNDSFSKDEEQRK